MEETGLSSKYKAQLGFTAKEREREFWRRGGDEEALGEATTGGPEVDGPGPEEPWGWGRTEVC